MHVVEIRGRGSPDCLQFKDEPQPVPGPGQLRVAVNASGVNFADVLDRQNLYPDAPMGNYVPGY